MSSRRILMPLGLLSYIAYAISATEMGPALSQIRAEFALSGAVAGLLVGLQALGGVFALPGGVLSDFFGRGRVVVISLGLMGAGAFLISSSHITWMLGASFLIFGIGMGFYEASVNAFFSEVYSDRRGLAINILHMGWGVGSTMGPMLAAFMILVYGSWRLGYLLVAPFLLGLSSGMWILTSSWTRATGGIASGGLRAKLSSLRRISPLMLISFLIVLSQLGLTAWLPSILVDQGGSLAEAGVTVGAFWALVSVGRLLWAPFIDRLGYQRTIILAGGSSSLPMILASLPIPIHFKEVLWACSGLLIAPAYPTLLAWATASDPEIGGTLSGIIFTFGTLGSFTSSAAVGLLFDVLGSTYAQLIFPIGIASIALISLSAKSIQVDQPHPD